MSKDYSDYRTIRRQYARTEFLICAGGLGCIVAPALGGIIALFTGIVAAIPYALLAYAGLLVIILMTSLVWILIRGTIDSWKTWKTP